VWPEIVVRDEDMLRHVARHVPDGGEPASVVRTLKTSDLYFAVACAQGDAEALAVFERDFFSFNAPALARMRFPSDVVDEARQVLRARFFAGDAPRILEYSGTGPLRAWVRAALVREALRVMRLPKGQHDVTQETIAAIASPTVDLELDYLKRHYGAAALEALGATFPLLETRERNVLRQYFAHGLSIDEIAILYRVHRSSAARWVTNARETLVENTREALRQRLGIPTEDLSSIMRLLESQLTEGIRTLLVASEAPNAS
jgi:RNA polymerase sigma-70 factor (ECF subfamily)